MSSPPLPAFDERVRFLTHRGQPILLIDFSHLQKTEEILEVVRLARELVARQPLASVRTLSHVRGARYTPPVMDAIKELAAHNRPYVRAAAVVGMEGLHRLLYRAVLLVSRRNMETFDSLEEAQDWLATQ
ncbi:MAG: hypothetical protein JO040_06120 [Gemmatimonadetes bacterium]|nr:hypothetical protein [Gemmatimonadota bacterium]